MFLSMTVTEKWNHFIHVFTPIVDAHAPFRSMRLRNPSAPPLSDVTRDLMQRRRRALAEQGHGSAHYKELNRAVRSAFRRDTRDNIQRRIADSRGRSMWRSIRSVSGGRPAQVTPDATADQLNTSPTL